MTNLLFFLWLLLFPLVDDLGKYIRSKAVAKITESDNDWITSRAWRSRGI